MKNILIISTSLRTGSNSDLLADAFAQGAREAGHAVEKLSLRDKTIQFCKGCLACQKTQRCVIHDDANSIVQKMKDAQVLVFATPIYYYEMCGQMKTLLDRANPLFSSDYAFRHVYLLDFLFSQGASGRRRPRCGRNRSGRHPHPYRCAGCGPHHGQPGLGTLPVAM